MTPEEHVSFTRRLVEGVESDPDVIGVIGLGSTSGLGSPADEWSDHDVFVITVPGAQERFRSGPWWLPDSDRVVLWLRETEHGVAALYDDGHLVELAAFDEQELYVAKVNRARVLYDRSGITSRIDALRAATASLPPPEDWWLIGKLLTTLVVGVGRARRGEVLSGSAHVHGAAVDHLVTLLARHVEPVAPVLDALAPRRRVEQAYPHLHAALAQLVTLPVVDAAAAVLDLAEAEVAPRVDWPTAAATAVRRAIEA